MKALELKGKKFGKLTVLERIVRESKDPIRWLCLCDCGGTSYVRGYDLKRGKVKSCGCLFRSVKFTVKGQFVEKLYWVWRDMLRRCYSPISKAFNNYGGRGIKVCEEWHDFKNFYTWAEPLYSNGLDIDRVNNDGDYEPANCRFTTRSVNNSNRRKIRSVLGHTGVRIRYNYFQVYIAYENIKYYLGTFPTVREAVIARNEFIVKNNFPHKLQEVPE